MHKIILIVGLGGGLGSMARYALSTSITERYVSAFPVGTFVVNLIGCFVIGIVYGISEKFSWLTPEWRFFLTAGLCGGFTTFSAFTHEGILLLKSGQFLNMAVYAGLSVFAGLLLTWLGLLITKVL